ncbi:TRAP transporter substrate-binding protein [Halalkalibacter alkalisediminis]|uniref:TRAP transporter substrate-binding protein n=1 Tax=Halalkalibacter alkalisediminis TaxID=935616 RepID=A0ABV6NEZ2_9BACI|nr:TRAP transporter substrate-binding protein [Halalkalibacter alkalisediminis]
MKGFVAIMSFLLIGIITAYHIGFGIHINSDPTAVDKEIEGLNEKYVLKFSHVVAENTPKGIAASMFAELVREKTDGWVDVQVFPNGILYEAQEEFDALMKNEVQMIAPAFSEITVHDSKWKVMDLPFVFDSEEKVMEAFDGKIGELLFESIEKQGYKGMAYWDNSFKQITNNTRPIIEPDDVDGMSFRVMPSEVLMDTYRTLGARPRVYSFNEVYEILSDGIVDGTENTLSNIYSKGFHQKQKYMTISNHNYLGYAVLMNDKYWSTLPVEHQENINQAMKEVTRWLRLYAKTHNAEMLDRIDASGLTTIHYLSVEEKELWREQLDPVYQKYAGTIGEEIMNEVYLNMKKEE